MIHPSYGITTTTMQNEYDSMIASIKRYGGFYVARYVWQDMKWETEHQIFQD